MTASQPEPAPLRVGQLYEASCDLSARGIRPPALYEEGFPHNNCGGGCVRAGAAHFAHLYRQRPATFAEWEANEADVRAYLAVRGRGQQTILKRTRDGQAVPLPLSALREELERPTTLSVLAEEEWGGCGCFLDEEPQS